MNNTVWLDLLKMFADMKVCIFFLSNHRLPMILLLLFTDGMLFTRLVEGRMNDYIVTLQ